VGKNKYSSVVRVWAKCSLVRLVVR